MADVSYLNFPQVTLLKVVRKLLLRPGYFIIGLKAARRVRKYSAQHKGVPCWSTLSARIPCDPGRIETGRGFWGASSHGTHNTVDGPGPSIEPGRLPFPIRSFELVLARSCWRDAESCALRLGGKHAERLGNGTGVSLRFDRSQPIWRPQSGNRRAGSDQSGWGGSHV